MHLALTLQTVNIQSPPATGRSLSCPLSDSLSISLGYLVCLCLTLFLCLILVLFTADFNKRAYCRGLDQQAGKESDGSVSGVLKLVCMKGPPTHLAFTQYGHTTSRLVFSSTSQCHESAHATFNGQGIVSCTEPLPKGLTLTPEGVIEATAEVHSSESWVNEVVVANEVGSSSCMLEIRVTHVGEVIFEDSVEDTDNPNKSSIADRLVSVVVTICDGHSFDDLYRKVPQYPGKLLFLWPLPLVHRVHESKNYY